MLAFLRRNRLLGLNALFLAFAAYPGPLQAADRGQGVVATETLTETVVSAPVRAPALPAASWRQVQWNGAGTRLKTADVTPPSQLALIACRVEKQERSKTASHAPVITEPDWRLPVECMRVIETVRDAAAMTRLWLREMTPNLANHGTCAEVAMNYVPVWQDSHRNWLVVKVGCPVKIVDADGRTIGWHMPECQGTLPGTSYPLRCRFDPSEI